LQADMSQSIPLRTALRVQLDDIIMSDEVVFAVFVPFLEINYGLLKTLSTCNAMCKMV
jgi:hypothetical protein